jgi:hypothetical protein
MDVLGTLECFRVRMENGEERGRMPTFEDLWELDDVDQLLARLPDDHEINRSTVFYIVLYRNDEDEKGLYTGRTIRVLGRAQEHVRNVNNTSNHSRHYQLARRIMRHSNGQMRLVPISFIHPNEALLTIIGPWIEQLLMMLFESYNGALFADWTQRNTMEDIVSRHWSKDLAQKLTEIARTARSHQDFEAGTFLWNQDRQVQGFNWGSPLLEDGDVSLLAPQLWTRIVLYDESGAEDRYQFIGTQRKVRTVKQGTKLKSEKLYFTLKTIHKGRPDSGYFFISVYPKDCPGLEAGMTVNIVAEIMAPRGNRLPRHPTPFFPVPEVGPWDMYTDAAALGLSIVWQTKKGEWRSCALQKGIRTHRPATEWPGVTSAKYGDEVNYMQAHWVRVINFMGSIYQWEFRKTSPAPAFLPLLKPYPGRVRTVTIDFFNQKFVISATKKITRDVPRLQSLEANSTKLRNLYGHELAIGYPPQAGWLAGTRGTMCDMCQVYASRAEKALTGCKDETYQFGAEWGTTLVSCAWCRPLRRYCTWTQLPSRQPNERKQFLERYPHLVMIRDPDERYQWRSLPRPPFNLDLLNIGQDIVEEMDEDMDVEDMDVEDMDVEDMDDVED